MGVTIELQNLGDTQLCRENTVLLEHAFSGRQGAWRLSISGSLAADNRDLRVEGPSGFERPIVCPVLPLSMSPQQSAQSL